MPTKQKAKPGPKGLIQPRPKEPINLTALYTYEEAAGHLQISLRAMRRLVHDGKIGHVQINERRWRIAGRQLLDYIDRNARGPRR